MRALDIPRRRLRMIRQAQLVVLCAPEQVEEFREEGAGIAWRVEWLPSLDLQPGAVLVYQRPEYETMVERTGAAR